MRGLLGSVDLGNYDAACRKYNEISNWLFKVLTVMTIL